MILAPQTSIHEAVIVAERVRGKIDEGKINGIPHFTISLGVTEFREADNIESLLKRVDQLLYAAKAGGRNQVKFDNE
ncbi:MAG: diguanylate cyclase [Spirochaetales bacterium]|nr:diguanylate cyclase [Spirochaetales bacterium]